MMKRITKSVLAGLLTATLAVGIAGCGGDKGGKVINKGSGEIPESIKIYATLPASHTAIGIRSNNDVVTFREMEKLTGCHVEWIHPAQGTGGEKFNLMLVSGDLPDVIGAQWSTMSQTGADYAEDGILIPLSELIEENMPNLSAYLKERPDVKKQFTEEDGEIYYIPLIRRDKEMLIFTGPQIREDWLEKLGLEIPKTPDELYNVLKAFKEKDPNGNGKADEIPMSGVHFRNAAHGIGNRLWMFGSNTGFYLKDGKVTYGVLEDEFEEGLTYITKLFKEGLIDSDFLINDRSKVDSKFMNDRVGFIYSYQPTKFWRNMNDGRKVTGIAHLAKEGVKNNVFDTNRLTDITNYSVAITTANQNPSGTLKWLDNFFGGEGNDLYNFGLEGESHDVINGEKIFKPEILADGTYNEHIASNNSCWVGIQRWDYYKQILSPWGVEAIETWAKSDGIDAIIPPMMTFTTEEKDTITQIYAQIETYVDEKIGKIAIGNLSMDELPKIREQIKKMGIDQIIDIYQAALKRYNSR